MDDPGRSTGSWNTTYKPECLGLFLDFGRSLDLSCEKGYCGRLYLCTVYEIFLQFLFQICIKESRNIPRRNIERNARIFQILSILYLHKNGTVYLYSQNWRSSRLSGMLRRLEWLASKFIQRKVKKCEFGVLD